MPLAETLRRFRKQRDYITHKIATHAAQRTNTILTEQQEHARNRTPYPSQPDLSFEELQLLQPSTTLREERGRDLQDIIQWYPCLAKANTADGIEQASEDELEAFTRV